MEIGNHNIQPRLRTFVLGPIISGQKAMADGFFLQLPVGSMIQCNSGQGEKQEIQAGGKPQPEMNPVHAGAFCIWS